MLTVKENDSERSTPTRAATITCSNWMKLLNAGLMKPVRLSLMACVLATAGCSGNPADLTGGVASVGATRASAESKSSVQLASTVASPQAVGAPVALPKSYTLAPGDKLRILVFNETEMSREYEVDTAGKVTLALIGAVHAAGKTPSELQEALREALGKGYLRNPKVSVEVSSYRPFYVIGEVTKAGEYPFKNGMNVISAVAVAGGYSYRANSATVYIRRAEEPTERAYEASNSLMIYPGDIVRVPERFF
jgi:protein involved in polysaccharide export with SLBB domain